MIKTIVSIKQSSLRLLGIGFVFFFWGCSLPNAEQPEEIAKLIELVPRDGEAFDSFGKDVSISGDYLLIGAYFDDDGGNNTGSAYVFRRTGTNSWDGGTKLTAPDGAEDDQFGYDVSLSGDYAIVGSRQDDNGGNNSGSAYVFRRTGINSWDMGTKITADDGGGFDLFGGSVSISGDYAVVGASGHDSYSGSVYVFHRTDLNSWTQVSKIISPDSTTNYFFGSGVSIFGEYIVVGSEGYEGFRGSAYIFHRNGEYNWEVHAKITVPAAAEYTRIGNTVAISGDYAVAGAYGAETNGNGSGSAYIYYIP